MPDRNADNDATVSGKIPLQTTDGPTIDISQVRPSNQAPSAPSIASFAPDDVAAGRFRIIRFLARGGMGEVYEAEDLELKECVALKTVRLEIAHDEHSLDRFRREIQRGDRGIDGGPITRIHFTTPRMTQDKKCSSVTRVDTSKLHKPRTI